MSNKIKDQEYFNAEKEEFGKYSWIKPALVFGAIGVLIYGIIVTAPYLLESIQGLFMFLMFFGLLG